jgi:hypothetical protein
MVCVTGNTGAAEFPVCGGGEDAPMCSRATDAFDDFFDDVNFSNIGFVTCFNFDGNAFGVTPTQPTSLAYSTFLGGETSSSGAGQTVEQTGTSIQIDDCDNVYVTGFTDATDFPVTPGAPFPMLAAEAENAFVTVFDSNGSPPESECELTDGVYRPCSPVFSTYLGGSGEDLGAGIALDLNDNILVGGQTGGTSLDSDDFPVTQGTFQPTFGGGGADGFIAKFGTIAGQCKVDNCALAVTVTQNAAPSGSAGQTIPAGSFTLTNLCQDAVFIDDVQIQLSDPGLFSSFSLASTVEGIQSSTPGTPAATTKFTFSSQQQLLAGDEASYALSAVIASNASDTRSPFAPATTASSSLTIFGSEQLNSRGHAVLNVGVPITLGTISQGAGGTATPSPTPTATPTPLGQTPTPTHTPAPTNTPTATRTPVPTATPTPTAASPTATPSPTPTAGPPTATPTATATPAFPPASISVAPTSLTFPVTGIGARPPSKTFVIRNLSKTNPLVGTIAEPAGPFFINPSGAFAVLPKKSTKVQVIFNPTEAMTYSIPLEIDSNDPAHSTLDVTLAGTGEAGVFSAPTSVTFKPTKVGTSSTRRVVLRNRGKGVLSGSLPALAGSFTASPSGPFTLNPGKSLTLSITFQPEFTGGIESEVLIFVSPPSTPAEPEIELLGTGK